MSRKHSSSKWDWDANPVPPAAGLGYRAQANSTNSPSRNKAERSDYHAHVGNRSHPSSPAKSVKNQYYHLSDQFSSPMASELPNDFNRKLVLEDRRDDKDGSIRAWIAGTMQSPPVSPRTASKLQRKERASPMSTSSRPSPHRRYGVEVERDDYPESSTYGYDPQDEPNRRYPTCRDLTKDERDALQTTYGVPPTAPTTFTFPVETFAAAQTRDDGPWEDYYVPPGQRRGPPAVYIPPMAAAGAGYQRHADRVEGYFPAHDQSQL